MRAVIEAQAEGLGEPMEERLDGRRAQLVERNVGGEEPPVLEREQAVFGQRRHDDEAPPQLGVVERAVGVARGEEREAAGQVQSSPVGGEGSQGARRGVCVRAAAMRLQSV